MPPWLGEDSCNNYQNDFSLSSKERGTLIQWVRGGSLEGDPDSPAPVPERVVETLSRIDRTLQMPEPYTPLLAPDDYRCFIIDWPETETRYLTGFGAVPGNKKIVHHIIAFLGNAEDLPLYQSLDDADPGPGYTCFGGPGGSDLDSFGWLGAWVPGNSDADFPASTGLKIEPGSKIILQMHYNVLTETPDSDQTVINLKLDSSVEREAFVLPWANPAWFTGDGMLIPAGEKEVKHGFAFDPTLVIGQLSGNTVPGFQPIAIHAATPHMHTLGSKVVLSVDRSLGPSTCLVDIPRWDFNWQSSYILENPVILNPGDRLSINCEWNNSALNQPIVDGALLPARDVTWGDGTTDEMCLGVFYVTQP